MNKSISEINRKAWNKIVKEGKTIHASKNKKEDDLLNTFVKLIPCRGKVLDLGCGTGIPISKRLSDAGFDVIGVDVSDEMIKQSKKNLPKGFFYRMPMTDIKWEKVFDGIVSSYSLLCLPSEDFNLMSGKIYTALKNGGWFLLFLNEGNSKFGQIQEVQGEQMYSTGVSEKEIREKFETKGMKIVKLEREVSKTKEYGVEHTMMFLMHKP